MPDRAELELLTELAGLRRELAEFRAELALGSGVPGRLLSRRNLAELGLERRAVDAVFRALPVVVLPGYSRPMVRAEDYLELLERSTYGDDRVRP